MRIANGMLVALLGIATAHAEEAFRASIFSPTPLDQPGALEALRVSNPGHYARAVAVLELASEMPCEGLPKILQAQAEATSVACRPGLIMTSWPAKREVTFALDDTIYTARVELRQREHMEPVSSR